MFGKTTIEGEVALNCLVNAFEILEAQKYVHCDVFLGHFEVQEGSKPLEHEDVEQECF